MRPANWLPGAHLIRAVPAIAVNGAYLVSMDVGRKVALEVVDHLIALEQGGTPASGSTD